MAWLMLVLCAAMWGGTWVALKIAESAGMPPLQFAALRALPAGFALLAVTLAVRSNPRHLRENWRMLSAMSLTTAIFFGLGAYGAQYLPGGLSSLLGNTTPLFIVIVAALVFRQSVPLGAIVGVAIGFAGVAIIALPALHGERVDLLGMFELLCGACALAFNTIWTKQLAHLDPFLANAAQMLGGGGMLVALALPVGEFPAVPLRADHIVPILYVSLLATAVAYVMWLLALRAVSATAAGSMTLLVPVFGHLWSGLILHEPIDAIELFGAAVVLGGIGLTILVAPQAENGERSPNRLDALLMPVNGSKENRR